MRISSYLSRLVCSPAAEFASYASPSFPPARPLTEALLDLTARIYKDFRFDSKATNVSTTPEEVLRSRRGVCQDFAHLASRMPAIFRTCGQICQRIYKDLPASRPPQVSRRRRFTRLGVSILPRHRLAGRRSHQ